MFSGALQFVVESEQDVPIDHAVLRLSSFLDESDILRSIRLVRCVRFVCGQLRLRVEYQRLPIEHVLPSSDLYADVYRREHVQCE